MCKSHDWREHAPFGDLSVLQVRAGISQGAFMTGPHEGTLSHSRDLGATLSHLEDPP